MRTRLPSIVVFAVVCWLCLAGCDFLAPSTTTSAPSTRTTPTPVASHQVTRPTSTPTPTPTPKASPTPGISVATEVGLTTSLPLTTKGGLLRSAGGGAVVLLPPRALGDSNATVSVLAQDAAGFPSPAQLASHVYDLGPSGLVFDANINITLSVVGTIGPDVRPVMAFLNAQNAWQVIPNSVYDRSAKTVRAAVNHFTNFAVYLIPADGSNCAPSPDPNAYCASYVCDFNANMCRPRLGSVAVPYAIGGTIRGLGSAYTTLLINNARPLTLHGDGNFAMGITLTTGSNYNVTVALQPNNTICQITNGGGIIADANVTNIAVTCLPTILLGVSVSGLNTGAQLTLQNANSQLLIHSVAGSHTFPRLPSGTDYNVVVLTQPLDQLCSVTDGAGTTGLIDVVLDVNCISLSHTLGGSVVGLLPTTVVRLANGRDSVTVGNGNYAFATVVHGGDDYNVIITSPIGQTCGFYGSTLGAGSMPTGPLLSVNVACVQGTHSIGGVVVGLSGGANVTLINGSDSVSAGNGNYVFSTPVPYGSTATLTISNPPGQTCRFGNGNSFFQVAMGIGDVTNANVTCGEAAYTLGGRVTGLVTASPVILFDGNNTASAGNGNFVLPATRSYGEDYNFTLTAPTGHTCVFVSGQSGQVTANVTNMIISCTAMTFSLGGTVAGLLSNTNVVLASGNDLISVSNGTFAFPSPIVYSSFYVVSLNSPANQNCLFVPLSSNIGAMGPGNVNSVNVVCAPHGYGLGGTVTGLVNNAAVTLTNGADQIAVRNGFYRFPTAVAYNSNYAVALASPASITCVFSPNNNSAGVMSGMDVTNVNVVCTPATFALSGYVSGLMANTNLTVTHDSDTISAGNGNYLFPTLVPYGTPYTVSVVSPAGQNCVFAPTAASSGIMPAASVRTAIVCTQITYLVGGSVSGLLGTLNLSNGSDTISVTRNGNFVMGAALPGQADYNVVVSSQPTNQLCSVSQGAGTIAMSRVSNVVVTCVNTHFLAGHVSNLASGANVIVGNGNDSITTFGRSPNFVLPIRLPPGADYNIFIRRQPVGETCSVVSGGVGTMGNQDVPNILIQCVMSLSFRTQQNAAYVIGQTAFDVSSSAIDNVHMAGPMGAVFEAPDGALYMGDPFHHRMVVYKDGVPSSNGQAFDYVVGQKDFATVAGWTTPGAHHMLPASVVGNQNYLVEVDAYDSRVLILKSFPTATVSADIVVGQPSFVSTATACTQTGLNTPRGAALTQTHALLVADTANNRVLIWRSVPLSNGQGADLVLGQSDFSTCAMPGTNASGGATLSQPYDVWSDGTHVLVADTYAARVLIWNTFPTDSGQPADAVLGQDNFATNTPRQGATSVGGPAGVTSDGRSIFVSELAYSRVTQWSGVPWSGQTPNLTAVLGAPDASTTFCNRGTSAASDTLCQPAGISIIGTQLIVADVNNNRLLVYQSQ